MAQSRLERVASLFMRVKQLHEAQKLPPEDLPLWYNIYKAFPPKYDPKYNRKYEKKPLKQIFYHEDVLRAKFQQDIPETRNSSLLHSNPSPTQRLIETYYNLKEREKDLPEKELYEFTINEYKSAKNLRKSNEMTTKEKSKLQKINIEELLRTE